MNATRMPLLLAAVGAFILSACSPNTLRRPFAAGEYMEVVRAFEADSSLHVREDALYLVALAYALPGSEAHDPRRALETLDRLITIYPAGPRVAHARHLHAIVSETDRLARDNAEFERLLSDARSALEAEHVARAAFADSLATVRTRAGGLQSIADQLAREVRNRDARIQALEEELAALKEIDLNRPPPVDARPPAGSTERP